MQVERGRKKIQDTSGSDVEVLFNLHYAAHAQIARRYLLGKTPSREVAEELLQETFLAVWNNLVRNKEVHSPQSWILHIAQNKITDYYRREAGGRRRRLELQANYLNTRTASPDISRQISAVLDNADTLLSLDYRHRVLYEKIAIHRLSYSEAAELMNIPVGTVRSRIHTIRKRVEADTDAFPGVSTAGRRRSTAP